MRSVISFTPRYLGRIAIICIISSALFMGVTGFAPLENGFTKDLTETTSAYIPPSAEEFARQYSSITSHNLIVEKEELRCLALNIYWEARSEPLSGQLAVAGVTMNRVSNPKFPDSICGVVQHSKSVRLHRCQFSWWCDGKKDTPREEAAWKNAQQLARLFVAGIYNDPTENALWYHADYVKPAWAQKLVATTKIGRHIFYREEDQVTASLY